MIDIKSNDLLGKTIQGVDIAQVKGSVNNGGSSSAADTYLYRQKNRSSGNTNLSLLLEKNSEVVLI